MFLTTYTNIYNWARVVNGFFTECMKCHCTAVTAGLNWLYFGHTESEKEQGRSRETVHVYSWSDSICASTAAQSPLVQEITHGCCLKGVKVKNELGLVVTSHAVSLSRRGRMRWSYCTAADTQRTPSLLKVSIN